MSNTKKNNTNENKKRNKREIYQIDQANIEDNIRKLNGGFEKNKVRYDFAIRLNDLLTEKKKDQESFAKNVNIAVGTLSNYRNGLREPSLTVLVKMAEELNVSINYLVGEDECPNYDLQDINKKTGLSQPAIETLYRIQHEYFELEKNCEVDIEEKRKISKTYKEELYILSQIIQSNIFLIDLLYNIKEYKKKMKELHRLIKSYKETKDEYTYLQIREIVTERKRLKFNAMETFSNIIEDISKGENQN